MFAGFLAAMAVASQIPQFHEMFDGATEPIGLMLAAGVMFVVGAVDDLREVSPPAKVAGRCCRAASSRCSASRCSTSACPFATSDYVVLSADLAPLVTVLTVV